MIGKSGKMKVALVIVITNIDNVSFPEACSKPS